MSEKPAEEGSERNGGPAVTVPVSSDGRVTIPEVVRETLGIGGSGHVRFRETDGGVVVERVPTVEEMQGFAAEVGDAETDVSATELLRQMRNEH